MRAKVSVFRRVGSTGNSEHSAGEKWEDRANSRP
jgi:hypothetical protein